MAMQYEGYDPFTQLNGFSTNKTVTLGGATTISGALTLSGAAPAFTNAPSGPQVRAVQLSALVGATIVLTSADSGKVCINRSTSGSPSWTLPAESTNSGAYFTFVTANTTAGFTVTSATGVIHFKTSASGTVLTSTTTLTNTQATAIVGDTISIACDGTAWWMTAISGTFAAS
ncbi:MAG TPA: hypothetical protein VF974_04825 [Patescibacteria group bacterium]